VLRLPVDYDFQVGSVYTDYSGRRLTFCLPSCTSLLAFALGELGLCGDELEQLCHGILARLPYPRHLERTQKLCYPPPGQACETSSALAAKNVMTSG